MAGVIEGTTYPKRLRGSLQRRRQEVEDRRAERKQRQLLREQDRALEALLLEQQQRRQGTYRPPPSDPQAPTQQQHQTVHHQTPRQQRIQRRRPRQAELANRDIFDIIGSHYNFGRNIIRNWSLGGPQTRAHIQANSWFFKKMLASALRRHRERKDFESMLIARVARARARQQATSTNLLGMRPIAYDNFNRPRSIRQRPLDITLGDQLEVARLQPMAYDNFNILRSVGQQQLLITPGDQLGVARLQPVQQEQDNMSTSYEAVASMQVDHSVFENFMMDETVAEESDDDVPDLVEG